MVGVLRIVGGSVTDVVCQIDAPGLPDITYNVTRLEKTAFSGGFGPPSEGRFDQLHAPAPGWDKWGGLNRAKVGQFVGSLGNQHCSIDDWQQPGGKRVLRLIDIPTIAVAVEDCGVLRILPVDGNHRMMARQLRGYKTFRRFVVPSELEKYYRVSFEFVEA